MARLNSAFKRLMSVHWVMAGFYVLLFLTGTVMAQLPREVVIRNPLYDIHKSLGALTMALLSWRILVLLQVWWKKYSQRLPRFSRSWWERTTVHVVLYGLMWGVPVTGFLLSNSWRSNNVKLFGLVLPDLFPENRAMVEVGRSLHFWLAYAFLSLIVLHMLQQGKVVKALWRRFQQFSEARPLRPS
ncbi:cytochrome b [Synechococcus sp. RSCCF101]|uniref:cytochrome b n=1 Tax=Synechococcus sp. RSCCF101 TaxID=2511069 RepID=UPI001CD9FACC|nr:cytochrome b/b6 domain-containing protein [Synechococcus sp. RSCCF101]